LSSVECDLHADAKTLHTREDRDIKGDPQCIMTGGKMAILAYRTQDGLADYGFSIEFLPDIGWRIYIIFTPYHQSDNESHHHERLKTPYQSIDDDGRHYVDWSGKIENLAEAKIVAELWAELTRCYQHLGAQATDNDVTAEAPETARKQRTDAA
jgi:hypothetical protein